MHKLQNYWDSSRLPDKNRSKMISMEMLLVMIMIRNGRIINRNSIRMNPCCQQLPLLRNCSCRLELPNKNNKRKKINRNSIRRIIKLKMIKKKNN